MFRAVRSWWRGGRGKVTARLFLFEFVVVVAGVLVAQWVSDLAADRAVARQVREDRSRVEYQIARSRQYARVWKAALPCLRGRMATLIAAAGNGERFSGHTLIMPRGRTYAVEPVSDDIARAMRDTLGDQRMEDYYFATNVGEALRAATQDAQGEWSKFAVLAPEYGALEAADRAALRAAGAQALRHMRRIEFNADALESLAAQLGISPAAFMGTGRGRDIFPVRNCTEMWRTQSIFRSTP